MNSLEYRWGEFSTIDFYFNNEVKFWMALVATTIKHLQFALSPPFMELEQQRLCSYDFITQNNKL